MRTPVSGVTLRKPCGTCRACSWPFQGRRQRRAPRGAKGRRMPTLLRFWRPQRCEVGTRLWRLDGLTLVTDLEDAADASGSGVHSKLKLLCV